MNFKLKGNALPGSFSDWIIENLGRRILQPYARSDADALYQDLDATAKTATSPSDIQKRFARYTKQHGAMGYVEYKGLAGVKNIAGVPHYELVYLVRAEIPKAGTAIMMVTAVDRKPRPGIISFDFKDSGHSDEFSIALSTTDCLTGSNPGVPSHPVLLWPTYACDSASFSNANVHTLLT